MPDNDMLVLNEMIEAGSNLKPSIQVEKALTDINIEYLTSPLAKIPFSEIAALGGAFSGVVEKMATSTAGEVFRCVFPEGVKKGALAMAKDGTGYLGLIFDKGTLVANARWVPVETAVGPACLKAVLIAVAVLAVAKQIQDIKDGQKEIIGILERDKKSQLLADYDLLAAYLDEYQFYYENEMLLNANLNQVKAIIRNAMKDIRSYVEQIEGILSAKKNPLKMKSASTKIGQILDRFVHYKLALHVFALAEYMEVMLSKNFQSDYLKSVEDDLRNQALTFINLYTACFDKIEILKKEAITAQAVNKSANALRSVGSFIGSIPLVKEGPVDEFLIGVGDTISEAEKNRLEKTLAFFIQYKDSGLIPIAEHIATINYLSNKPVVMLYDKDVLCFHVLQESE